MPLDIFPSEMLDRLEVTKSLTANMEGDGIGGAVNLIMKDAPSERQFTANLSTGYNAMCFGRDFQSFNRGGIVKKSPYEGVGETGRLQSDDGRLYDFEPTDEMEETAAGPDCRTFVWRPLF